VSGGSDRREGVSTEVLVSIARIVDGAHDVGPSPEVGASPATVADLYEDVAADSGSRLDQRIDHSSASPRPIGGQGTRRA
jgi:hypothetical protein